MVCGLWFSHSISEDSHLAARSSPISGCLRFDPGMLVERLFYNAGVTNGSLWRRHTARMRSWFNPSQPQTRRHLPSCAEGGRRRTQARALRPSASYARPRSSRYPFDGVPDRARSSAYLRKLDRCGDVKRHADEKDDPHEPEQLSIAWLRHTDLPEESGVRVDL
jgi:hypothetical protein